MRAILSSLGVALDAIVQAIWTIITTLASLAATLIVTFFDIIYDILCCNCFGNRQKRTGTHVYKFGKKKAKNEDKAEAPAAPPAN